jgi:hypothetical protein
LNQELKAEIVRRFGNQFLFATFVGAHESDVSRVIRGRRQLDDATKREWADVLQVPVEQIFPSEGSPVPRDSRQQASVNA